MIMMMMIEWEFQMDDYEDAGVLHGGTELMY